MDNYYDSCPLAYKFVVVAVMLAEINHCASRLHLPIDLPIQKSDIRRALVDNPYIRIQAQNLPIEDGFGGVIDTDHYSFSFPPGLSFDPKPGKLRFITRLDNGYQAYSTSKYQGDLATADFLPQLAGIHLLLNTNSAYQLATNWLADMDVDVQRLNKEQPWTVQQEHWGDEALPIFDVIWGEWKFGSSGKFLSGMGIL